MYMNAVVRTDLLQLPADVINIDIYGKLVAVCFYVLFLFFWILEMMLMIKSRYLSAVYVYHLHN